MNKPVNTKWRNAATRPQKHQPVKGPCFNFCMSIGVTSPKNEEQAVLQLLEIHDNWRARELKRECIRATLPRWKKWIINTFNLPI